MCCTTNQTHASQGCGCAMGAPSLWSKKKKLEVLSQRLEFLKEQEKDIQEAIDELSKSR